jgi:hypothetical protein
MISQRLPEYHVDYIGTDGKPVPAKIAKRYFTAEIFNSDTNYCVPNGITTIKIEFESKLR